MDIEKDYLVIIKNFLPSMHQGEKNCGIHSESPR